MSNPSRAYRMLLMFFPREVRRADGEEMLRLFAEQHARARGAARLRLWLRAIGDAMRHGTAERIEHLRDQRQRSINRQPAKQRVDMFIHDARYALRMLARQPGAAATIILTLALGIGANTAVFSVVHAVLLKPLPYADPDRLVRIFEKRPAEGVFNNSVSPADFLDWARTAKSFTSMTGYSATRVDLTGVGDPAQLAAAGVSAAFFDVLGVRALFGRTFHAGDDVLGRHRVVIVSHSLWQQRFGSDRNVIGRKIDLNGLPHEIIGVLPPEFEFPGETADLWAPLVLQGGPQPAPRASHYLEVYARLAPGASLESSRAEMDRIGKDLEAAYPTESQGHGAHVVSLRDEIVGPARNGLLVVMSAVAFLLLIACTNVANLLLARGVGRRREMAIRAAVGAAGSRLLRQTLTESMVMSAIGGAAGLLVASMMVRILVAETPPALRAVGLERAQLDLPVLAFTAGICAITAILAGVLPAWQVSRQDPGDPMRESGRSPMLLKRRFRFTLIAAEVALTVLLLVGAGLMLRSFVRVLSQPAGFAVEQRLVVHLGFPRLRYPDSDALRRVQHALDERFNSIAGVTAAGATSDLPLGATDARRGITVEGLERVEGDAPVRAHSRIVTPRYFQAMGITVKEGRGLQPTDDAQALMVTVINDTMARRYWPGQSPIGKRVRWNAANEPWREVVGIINDVKYWGLDREVNPEMYVPFDQVPVARLAYVLHTSGDPSLLVSHVSAHVKELDPNLPLGNVQTMEAVALRSVSARRWSALLLGLFAVLGLALAAAGIFGVLAHVVSMRTSEIGIRMTLGAKPISVLRQVLGEALLQAGVGLAAGLALAATLLQGLNAMLFEITAFDPLTFAVVIVAVTLVTLLAGAVPALRAMRVDPVKALRTE